MDTWMGINSDPITLNKYLYANADPVNFIDPSGNISLGSLMSGINGSARLVAAAVPRYISSKAVASRVTINSTLGMLRNFTIQANRAANASRKIVNGGKAVGKAVKEFKAFTRSKRFRNSGGANHFLDTWGPSSLNASSKNVFGKYRKVSRKLSWRHNRGGGPGRVFQIKYTIGKNGNPAQGSGFLFRLDYQDYTTTPSRFKPHYHLCGGDSKDCKKHHYL